MKPNSLSILCVLPALVAGCLQPEDAVLDPPPPPQAVSANTLVAASAALRAPCDRGGAVDIDVTRVVGALDALRAHGAISEVADLRVMVRDGDADTHLAFNGAEAAGTLLSRQGDWSLLSFEVPITQVRFPADPGPGGRARPAKNTVALTPESRDALGCDAVAWASLTVERAPLPVLLVHGMFDSPMSFNELWRPNLDSMGIPVADDLYLGDLDPIAVNAGKIQDRMAKTLEQFGVERVNIVAHSKGGLDARHYVETHDTVEHLIQIGTPNAGSRLADRIQTVLVLLFGITGPNLINLMQQILPGALELTTGAMSIYNATHGHNTGTQYISLAGDYRPRRFCFFDPDPFGCVIEKFLTRLVGRGDTIVRIQSAHALSYADALTLFTAAPDKQAKHDPLIRSQVVFDRLLGYLTGSSATALSGPQAAGPVSAAGPIVRAEVAPDAEEFVYARTATIGGVIEPGDRVEHELTVDEGEQISFEVMHLEPGLDLFLISPDGEEFDPDRGREDPDLDYGTHEILGGLVTSYTVPAREPGTWLLSLVADGAEKPAGYAIHAVMENPSVRFDHLVEEPLAERGKPLRLQAKFSERPEETTVTAHVMMPEGDKVLEIELRDDGKEGDDKSGDGVFSGDFFETEQPGVYRVAFTAHGISPRGVEFTRESFAALTVTQ